MEILSPPRPTSHLLLGKDELISEALDFLRLLHDEQAIALPTYQGRMTQVQQEVAGTGTYHQTLEEITLGSKIAWRNSNRCIGRIYWRTLRVNDCRHLETADEIYEALLNHIELATNEGQILSLITIFAPETPSKPAPRIWNPQLIRYAGYTKPDGTIIGDPAHLEITRIAQKMGWSPNKQTHFDVLPLIIQAAGKKPKLYELPENIILEVPIEHPDYPAFADLGLKWHALPAISGMRLEIGGISYPTAPFNGWYMGTEIGARNFGDTQRYNMLPKVAQIMGLDTSAERTLWRDRAMVELNVAVLHSFEKHKIRIIDHHTVSDFFLRHRVREALAGRITPGEWSWIVPPISGSATPVFHQDYPSITLKPNYFYQPNAWLYNEDNITT